MKLILRKGGSGSGADLSAMANKPLLENSQVPNGHISAGAERIPMNMDAKLGERKKMLWNP